MITQPTVVVLGAGASCPYGFPSAFQIVDQVCREVSEAGRVTDTLQRCGFPPAQIEDFLHRVKNSGRSSIDAFLQRHSADHSLRLMGKIAVVTQLHENDPALRMQPESLDWLRYLITRMCPLSPAGFEANNLQIVTFNFDRTVERRLFLMLRHGYPIDDQEAARLVRAIPIVHVHGQLGTPAWLFTDDSRARDFVPPTTPDDIRACAEQIRLVDEEISPETIRSVRTMLETAERICFLGFSFHSDNLNRLGANQWIGNKTVWGTRHGMSEADVSVVYRRFNSPRQGYLLDRSVRAFFDVVNLFE